MAKLEIKSTEFTPEVNFDSTTGVFDLTGKSYPNSAALFYEPIMEWVRTNTLKTKSSKMVLDMEYFNSTSASYILVLMELIASSVESLEIYWYCEEDDDDMVCAASYFFELLSNENIKKHVIQK